MKQELKQGLAWAAFMLVLAIGASVAHRLGYIDRVATTRLVTVPTALYLAWYGNRMPKVFLPSAGARQQRRVAAWSFVISGLFAVGLFAFAPIAVAPWAGSVAILAGVAVSFGYCLSRPARPNAA